jgi:hypothetical protein
MMVKTVAEKGSQANIRQTSIGEETEGGIGMALTEEERELIKNFRAARARDRARMQWNAGVAARIHEMIKEHKGKDSGS